MFEIIGYIFIFFIIILLLFEGTFRILELFADKFSKDVNVKDFIPKNYHQHVDYYTSWENALFNYDLTIGYRLINSENKLSKKLFKINSLGFRSEEFEEKKDNDLVVLFSGASTAFGCGASSEDKTITEQFKKKLTNLFPSKNVKVYNLAQINNYQTQEIIIFIFFLKKLRPDIVISINGWNELIRNNFISDNAIKKYNVFNITELEGWEPARVTKNKKKNFLNHLYLYLEDYSALVRSMNLVSAEQFIKRQKLLKLYRNFDDSIITGSELYVKNFEIFNNLSRSFNFKYFTFLQPYITLKENLTEEEKKLIFHYKNHNKLFKDEDFIQKLYDTENIYKKLYSEAVNKNYNNIFDFSSLFSKNNENIYCTSVHLNDTGQEIFAKKIFETLNKKKVFDEYL